ncbi:hypothetical protein FE782_01955 [Paenibacillus antri]|uniref:NACHT-associated inactive Restriction Endonuclease 2 domain-containing protein n=1 Tax=Paenibacillus antri TaxID=2582848 RepID=A0A5R9GKK0_9BACL|nr:pentapeptide repeat-containing protein [Paenibacillus antri]TLS54134.1 hypothetical protein FE782_01955 [Paenibacillus antri]
MNYEVDREDIKKIYELYGFELIEEKPGYLVFAFKVGYFKNAELVNLSNSDMTETMEQLRRLGYNPQETHFVSLQTIRDRLFNGFFQVNYYRERVKKTYSEFAENQKKLLGIQYEYIKGNYLFENTQRHDDLISHILSLLVEQGPSLIVLEAAAGFGKTCTVYEIINQFVSQENNNSVPVMSELSRNRTAKIFRYILLDEIDKNFPNLNSDLVKMEIYNGRIPLIVDGFDELMIRSHAEADADFDEVESMLDTIGDMLKDNAKIILTSRKSALLSGDKFYQWIENRENDFKVSRFILNEPSIRDWIGGEKNSVINRLDGSIEKLLNPVILAFIRSLSIEEFVPICNNADQLIDKYFSRLLERERDRQNLKLETGEQLEIFQGLAYKMAVLGITSDLRENIKRIISTDFLDVLEMSRKRYYSVDRPDSDRLANTLAGHVLLDRNGSFDQVAFINEFVFGILLGNAMCEKDELDIMDIKFIDLACTSYSIRDQQQRELLYKKIQSISLAFSNEENFDVDVRLMNRLTRDYRDMMQNEINLKEFQFDSYKIVSSVFYSSTFSNMNFKKSTFSKTSFIDCKFYNCIFENDINEEREIQFINCSGSDSDSFIDIIDKQHSVITSIDEIIELEFEKIVIEQFWPSGKAGGQPKRHYRTLFYGVDHNLHPLIEQAIQRLRKRDILHREGEIYSLNYGKSYEIKQIRNNN